MSFRLRTATVAARAAGLALCSLLCAFFATAASAQSARVSVQDEYGYVLQQSSVSFRTATGDWQKADLDVDGAALVPTVGSKAVVKVIDPTYGAHEFEVSLPPNDQGVIVVRMSANGAQAKFQSMRYFAATLDPMGGQQNGVTCNTGVGCQLPDQLGHGGSGTLAATSDLNPAAGFIVADDFTAPSGGSVSSVCWWGIYFNFSTFTDCGPGTGDAFRIAYYNDDAGGSVPGSLAGGPFLVSLSNKFATGNLVCAGTTCIAEYQFEASHAAVALNAGQCYWVEIVNSTTSPNCFWLWNTAPPGDSRSAQFAFGAYAQTDFDVAFCLDVGIATDGCGAPAGPPNDNCANATAISGTGNFAFDNTNATQDGAGDTACDFFGTNQIDRDLWWCWTAPSSGDFAVSTCNLTFIDSKIAVYAGCSCATGSPLGCSDDFCGVQSSVAFTATAGNTYLIRVGSFPGSSGGTGSFSIGGSSVPGNDLCDDAIAIGVPSLTTGDTTNATIDSSFPTCVQSITAPGVWYSVTGTGTTMTADTCTGATFFDDKINIYCGTCLSPVCVTGNDDFCGLQSSVSWCSQFGAPYLILVHGFGGAFGPFELQVTENGVGCTPQVQCLPSGACCTANGCILTDAGTCASIGGSFQGVGTDCGGFTYLAGACTQGWEEISHVGTQIFLTDDSFVTVNLPFTFNFFGSAKNSVSICSNGFLGFGSSGLTSFSNVPIPDPFDPNDMVCGLWDDLNPGAGGQMYYAVTGVAPNRAFIAEWVNVPQFVTSDANTFEIILFELHNRISVRYLNVTPEGFPGDYTIGIENAAGDAGINIPGTFASFGGCLNFQPDTIPSDCPQGVYVDMTPGTCPNNFNGDSRSPVTFALIGTPSFDVTQVDYSSVLLARADRVGVAVGAVNGPPGPHNAYGDVATPWYGPVDQCHELNGDGIPDMSMFFRAQDLTDSFELAGLAPGTQIPLEIGGFLLDGTWFYGDDTLTVVAAPPTVNLNVRSNVVDLWVAVAPSDVQSYGDGWTNFERSYTQGATVTLTAADMPDMAFMGWRVGGQMVTPISPVLTTTLNQNTTVWAMYGYSRAGMPGGGGGMHHK